MHPLEDFEVDVAKSDEIVNACSQATIIAEPSTHKVEVVPVRLQKHPNADKLSVVQVFGYQCCTGTDQWKALPPADTDPDPEADNPMWLGAYIPPDTLVDVTLPEFSFLADRAKADGKYRVKAMKLRGVVSFGLLVPAPAGSNLGDDVSGILKTEHYEPSLAGEAGAKGEKFFTGGEVASSPNVYHVKYDVDAFRRYHNLFVKDELVIVTEKLDGANARYVFLDGKMHCGSRTEWKKEFPDYSHLTLEGLVNKGVPEDKAKEVLERVKGKPKTKNLWWAALEKTPALEKFCRDNPGVVVYGEVYGNVNCIKYGFPDGNRFAAFDLMKDGRWLDGHEAREMLDVWGVPQVPIVKIDRPELNAVSYQLPYDFETICKLAEGQTMAPGAKSGTIREGVVVKPLRERRDPHVGRVCFKCVSSEYLERYR